MFGKASKPTRKQSDLACIFVHAGAGFHSKENEKFHLQACNDACKAAMAILKAGGSAVDAVETAIKVLEDREITNAGYGSNLGFDGVVECDAIIVDPYGRSGAVGAVSQIKNPISLARVLLDHSTQSLTLRRMPPNLLVAQGATQFAEQHSMRVVPHDNLISPFAKHRWQKWRADLAKAERHKKRDEMERHASSPEIAELDLAEFHDENQAHENSRKSHEKAMLAHLSNDAQPISPPPSDIIQAESDSTPGQQSSSSWSFAEDEDNRDQRPEQPNVFIDPRGPPEYPLSDMSHHPFANSTQKLAPNSPGNVDGEPQSGRSSTNDLIDLDEPDDEDERPSLPILHRTGFELHDTAIATPVSLLGPSRPSLSDPFASPSTDTLPKIPSVHVQQHAINVGGQSTTSRQQDGADKITDTVGAIAIDMYGNIACGASSGGIGMKHRGRIGPAALVGVGASVIPVDPDDGERTSVATVTSGTGEHMSTTMASSVCSDRVYVPTRRVPGGMTRECMEEEAIRSFIAKDFMGHPSVKHSDSSGAIGMLCVKKTKDGASLFFGHNTDSFALASMHSDELRPVCTMSRSNGNGSIAQGGRGIRYRKKK